MFHNYSLDKRAIPMGWVVAMVRNLQQRGYPPALTLANTGITEAELRDPEQRVTYRQRIQQLTNVITLLDDPGYWLDSDAVVSVSDYGLLGYAMMSSATLDQAIQIAVKYHKTAGAMYELSFLREGRDAILRLDHLLAGGMVSRFMVEDLFMSIAPLITLLTGSPFQASKVLFNYDAGPYRERYGRAFNCEIEFDSQYCEYRFDADLLGEKLADADSNAAKSCEEACRKLLIQMEIEEDLVSRICHLLLSKPGEFPKLGVIAHRLSIGTRTLRRRLKGLGTSYQKILDNVKKELAIEYLQTTNLSVQEISDLLGYSEVTNFRRAFVKWVDLSPYQYRKSRIKSSALMRL